jgi:hypothetical protein
VRAPASATVIVHCGKCSKVAGWVQVMEGATTLVRPTARRVMPDSVFPAGANVYDAEGRAVDLSTTPRGARVFLTHATPIEQLMVGEPDADVPMECGNHHWGVVSVAEVVAARPKRPGYPARISTRPGGLLRSF